MPRPRKPWLAALLNLLAPGLGQLYNGRAFKAVAFLVGFPLAAIPLLWLATALPQHINVLLPLLGVLGLPLLSVLDAARDAHRLHDQPRPWYSRWYSCILVWALSAFLIGPATRTILLTSCVQAFNIAGGGMERTLLAGDHVLVDRAAYGIRIPYLASTEVGRRDPQRGDLVAFLYPEDRSRMFLKRVIGLPGEKVQLHGRTVEVEGKPFVEPYAFYLDPEDDARPDWGPQSVPAGQLFVLGDNRDNSRDSRYWGYVPISDVVGEAKMVYFSWEPRYKRVRWQRIGHTLH